MFNLGKSNENPKEPVKASMKGGTADFNWEDVRYMNYKDRECYLGYTVKIGFLDKGGKWKKKDWWTNKTALADGVEINEQDELKKELVGEKELDEKRMRIALGLEQPEEEYALPMQSSIDAREITKKIKQEAQEEEGNPDYYEKIAGIGFNSLAEDQAKKKAAKPTKQEMLNHYKLEGYGELENDNKKNLKDTKTVAAPSDFDLNSFLTRNHTEKNTVDESSKRIKKEKKDKKHKKDKNHKDKDRKHKDKDRSDREKHKSSKSKKHRRSRSRSRS